MPAKTDPVVTAYASWEEALEEWNDKYEAFQEEMKTSKKPSKSLISYLETTQENRMKRGCPLLHSMGQNRITCGSKKSFPIT